MKSTQQKSNSLFVSLVKLSELTVSQYKCNQCMSSNECQVVLRTESEKVYKVNTQFKV